jgi:hemoglobin
MFDALGGQGFFDDLVDAFYVGVENDEILREMYPADLGDARRHLALFLAQYWGGPPTYMNERGHPRLRMRHAEFAITKRARDAWLRHMSTALDAMNERLSAPQRAEFDAYFAMAAHQLRNV